MLVGGICCSYGPIVLYLIAARWRTGMGTFVLLQSRSIVCLAELMPCGVGIYLIFIDTRKLHVEDEC